MSKKIIVAKTSFNALTESSPDNLNFSSDYNTLKYYVSGNTSIQIVGDGSDQISETAISHGLGYIPFFIVYVNDFVYSSDDFGFVPYLEGAITTHREAHAFATNSHLYLRMRNQSNNTYTAYFYYKIYKNKLITS